MSQGDLVYFWLSLADAEKAKSFYGELLGWRFSPGNAPEGWNVEGMSPPGGLHGGNQEPKANLCFEVDELEAAMEKVRSLGWRGRGAAADRGRQVLDLPRRPGLRVLHLGRRPGTVTAIDPEQFFGVDMRVGRVAAVEDFPEARTPAWKLRIDFGPELGETALQRPDHPLRPRRPEGRLVVGVVNLPPRQIGPVRSEVLVLGALDPEKGVVLLRPDEDAALGSRIA